MDISIVSAHTIDIKLLFDFYDKVYPRRATGHIWNWLNRSYFYGNKTPLVIVHNNSIIAHAGMIPFSVIFDGKKYNAAWFIDFAVLPEFQKRGFGTLLTKKWMELTELSLALGCTEGSMAAFKKNGWVEAFDAYLHRYFLMPFNHDKLINFIPGFVRKILNGISRPLLKVIYDKYAFPIEKIRLEELNNGSLDRFTASLNTPTSGVIPVRDRDFISWRLLDSPDRKKYRIFSLKDNEKPSIIVKMCDVRISRYIDLLWISDTSDREAIRCMIATLAVWAMKNGYSYIRHYTADKEMSDYLAKSLKSLVTHPRFAFHMKDAKLLDRLKQSRWHWELIDNDCEWWIV